jgi:hypothetical protein
MPTLTHYECWAFGRRPFDSIWIKAGGVREARNLAAIRLGLPREMVCVKAEAPPMPGGIKVHF